VESGEIEGRVQPIVVGELIAGKRYMCLEIHGLQLIVQVWRVKRSVASELDKDLKVAFGRPSPGECELTRMNEGTFTTLPYISAPIGNWPLLFVTAQ
jgi:hypothetical protein